MVRVRYFKCELGGKLVELFESNHPARAIADISDRKMANRKVIITQIPEDVYRELQKGKAVTK